MASVWHVPILLLLTLVSSGVSQERSKSSILDTRPIRVQDYGTPPVTSTISLYDCTTSHRPKLDVPSAFEVYHDRQWYLQYCEEGLTWNQTLCRCEFPGGRQPVVRCRDYRATSTEPTGNYEQMVNGQWVLRDCSLSVAGLVWDQEACQCVWGPQSKEMITGQGIAPCEIMLNMTFENGVKDEAKGSFVEVGRGNPLPIFAVNQRGAIDGYKAAYFTDTALNIWYFAGNEMGTSLRVEFRFKMTNDPIQRDKYQIFLSNGCNATSAGYTTPSLAIGYRAADQSYLLAFETSTARKAIVCTKRLGAYEWHTISLIYEDGTLLFRVDDNPCIISQDFSGPIQKTPCPLTIGADPLERESMYKGYLDNILIARYCRRFMDRDSNDATAQPKGPMIVEAAPALNDVEFLQSSRKSGKESSQGKASRRSQREVSSSKYIPEFPNMAGSGLEYSDKTIQTSEFSDSSHDFKEVKDSSSNKNDGQAGSNDREYIDDNAERQNSGIDEPENTDTINNNDDNSEKIGVSGIDNNHSRKSKRKANGRSMKNAEADVNDGYSEKKDGSQDDEFGTFNEDEDFGRSKNYDGQVNNPSKKNMSVRKGKRNIGSVNSGKTDVQINDYQNMEKSRKDGGFKNDEQEEENVKDFIDNSESFEHSSDKSDAKNERIGEKKSDGFIDNSKNNNNQRKNTRKRNNVSISKNKDKLVGNLESSENIDNTKEDNSFRNNKYQNNFQDKGLQGTRMSSWFSDKDETNNKNNKKSKQDTRERNNKDNDDSEGDSFSDSQDKIGQADNKNIDRDSYTGNIDDNIKQVYQEKADEDADTDDEVDSTRGSKKLKITGQDKGNQGKRNMNNKSRNQIKTLLNGQHAKYGNSDNTNGYQNKVNTNEFQNTLQTIGFQNTGQTNVNEKGQAYRGNIQNKRKPFTDTKGQIGKAQNEDEHSLENVEGSNSFDYNAETINNAANFLKLAPVSQDGKMSHSGQQKFVSVPSDDITEKGESVTDKEETDVEYAEEDASEIKPSSSATTQVLVKGKRRFGSKKLNWYDKADSGQSIQVELANSDQPSISDSQPDKLFISQAAGGQRSKEITQSNMPNSDQGYDTKISPTVSENGKSANERMNYSPSVYSTHDNDLPTAQFFQQKIPQQDINGKRLIQSTGVSSNDKTSDGTNQEAHVTDSVDVLDNDKMGKPSLSRLLTENRKTQTDNESREPRQNQKVDAQVKKKIYSGESEVQTPRSGQGRDQRRTTQSPSYDKKEDALEMPLSMPVDVTKMKSFRSGHITDGTGQQKSAVGLGRSMANRDRSSAPEKVLNKNH